MPSSYTSSGIELIGSGEQSGTWGDTTNANLQHIDRMISQAASVSLAGTTHTLTVSDGGESDGHYAVLVFGGAPSGTNTVTISPNDARRVYFIQNDSGETVIMKQGTGSTVSIADGRNAIVYCDGGGTGAAVVDLSSDLVSDNLAAISALTPTNGNFIVGNGTTWVAESGNTVLASIGVTATTSELNTLDGFSGSVLDLNYAKDLRATGVTTTEFDKLDGVTGDLTSLNGVTWTLTALNGLTASVGELNRLDGVTWTLSNYNSLTASAAELNVLDGIPALAGNGGSALAVNSTGTAIEYVAFPEGSAYTAGAGLDLVGSEFSHEDTSSATGISTSGAQVVDVLSLDGFGHVTALTTRNLAPSDVGLVTGMIMMWSGSILSLPSGWLLCDGTNGTPDLRDRFVVGAGSSYLVGATGGSASVTLTEEQLPAHTHTFSGTTNTTGAHNHTFEGNINSIDAPPYLPLTDRSDTGGTPTTNTTTTAGDHSHTFSGTTSSVGDGESVENRPPYYALAYIMKS